jgi:hypothetical protein
MGGYTRNITHIARHPLTIATRKRGKAYSLGIPKKKLAHGVSQTEEEYAYGSFVSRWTDEILYRLVSQAHITRCMNHRPHIYSFFRSQFYILMIFVIWMVTLTDPPEKAGKEYPYTAEQSLRKIPDQLL